MGEWVSGRVCVCCVIRCQVRIFAFYVFLNFETNLPFPIALSGMILAHLVEVMSGRRIPGLEGSKSLDRASSLPPSHDAPTPMDKVCISIVQLISVACA
jgi:hypothetical protein